MREKRENILRLVAFLRRRVLEIESILRSLEVIAVDLELEAITVDECPECQSETAFWVKEETCVTKT